MAKTNERLSYNITSHGMSYNFRKFEYSYTFDSQFRLEEISKEGLYDKEQIRDHLVMEFKMALNTAIFGDPAGDIDDQIKLNNDQMEDIKNFGHVRDIKTLLEERLLKSLVDDVDGWTTKVTGGADAGTRREWYSPEYKTSDGENRVQFADNMLGLGCYINGTWKWNMSSNWFRKKVRTIRKALNQMKSKSVYHEKAVKEREMEQIIRGI